LYLTLSGGDQIEMVGKPNVKYQTRQNRITLNIS